MVAFVIVEDGGAWPGRIDGCAGIVAFTRSGDELLERTRSKLELLSREHQRVSLAVLACNAEASPQAEERRLSLGRALLAAIRESRFGRIVLTADRRAPRASREQLFMLVDKLTAELSGTNHSVALRFSSGARDGQR